MADQFGGAAGIGYLLAGGKRQMEQQAFDEGRLNTAKTEDALANARLSQTKATAAANAARAQQKFVDNYIATHSTDGRPPAEVAAEAQFLGDLIVSGGGADYYAGTQGLREQQHSGFERTMADPTASAVARTRAGQALAGKPSSDLVGIAGTGGYTDLTAEEPTVTIPVGGNKTTQQKNFEYLQGLPTPEAKDAFGRVLRADQVIDLGGGGKAARPTAGGTNVVVTPAEAAANEGTEAEAKKQAQLVANLRAEYPKAVFTRDRTKQDIEAQNKLAGEIAKNRSLWESFGLTQLVSKIPGSDGANIRALLNTLSSKLMLSTLINLRAMSKTGGAVGNVSDREGSKMETAIAALSDPNITVGQFLTEVDRLLTYNKELEGYIDNAFDLTYDKNGEPRLSTQGPRAPKADTAYSGGGEGEGSTEDLIVERGDGIKNPNGDIVRADGSGWILMRSPGGIAWVNPDGSGEYEEVAE